MPIKLISIWEDDCKFSIVRNKNNEFKTKVKKTKEVKCVYCGETNKNRSYEYDHILPVILGGTNLEDNIQILCSVCHRIKTEVDKKIIRSLKTLGFLIKSGINYHFYRIERKEVKHFYFRMFNKLVIFK